MIRLNVKKGDRLSVSVTAKSAKGLTLSRTQGEVGKASLAGLEIAVEAGDKEGVAQFDLVGSLDGRPAREGVIVMVGEKQSETVSNSAFGLVVGKSK